MLFATHNLFIHILNANCTDTYPSNAVWWHNSWCMLHIQFFYVDIKFLLFEAVCFKIFMSQKHHSWLAQDDDKLHERYCSSELNNNTQARIKRNFHSTHSRDAWDEIRVSIGKMFRLECDFWNGVLTCIRHSIKTVQLFALVKLDLGEHLDVSQGGISCHSKNLVICFLLQKIDDVSFTGSSCLVGKLWNQFFLFHEWQLSFLSFDPLSQLCCT